ncbi:P68 family surface lipoprotein [Mycoplasma struthionis]|nr:P80 family lipoprotein [Mycoplasma struthionis]
MKKLHKIILAVSSLAATASISAVAASCGGTKSQFGFDQKYDGKIKLAAGFSANGPQGTALNAIVEKYNDWIQANNKAAEGYLPVDIEWLAGGYNTNTLTTKLTSKDNATFWNLITNYPAAASAILQNRMGLPVSDEEYSQFGIAKSFGGVNDTIAGNTAKQKIVVPMSRSSEMIAVAKPLLGKLLDAVIKKGFPKADQNNTLVTKYVGFYNATENAAEKKAIDAKWGNESQTVTKEQLSKYITFPIDDSIFDSYEKLINFAIAAKMLFPTDSNNYVIGFDSLPNAINIMSASISGGDVTKGYITPNPEKLTTGGWDYSKFLNDPSSNEYKTFKKITELVLKGIENKAVWIGGAGAYGSSNLVNYQLAMSMGSTAGFSHTYIKDGEVSYTYNNTNDVIDKNGIFKITVKDGDTSKLFGLWKASVDKTDNYVAPGQVNNRKYTYEIDPTLANQIKGFKDHYVVSSLVAETIPGDATHVNLKTGNNGATKQKVEIESVELNGAFKKSVRGAQDDIKFYILKSTNLITKKTLGAQPGSVNFSDADWIGVPSQYSSEDPKHAVFEQGPSLIGIHANEQEDKATKLFIGWIMKEQLPSINISGKEFTNVTPLDAFNLYGGYISPTEAFFKHQVTDPEITKLTLGNQVAYKAFKKTVENPEWIVASDVASTNSDPLRQAITSAGKSAMSDAAAGTVKSFNDFLAAIKRVFTA